MDVSIEMSCSLICVISEKSFEDIKVKPLESPVRCFKKLTSFHFLTLSFVGSLTFRLKLDTIPKCSPGPAMDFLPKAECKARRPAMSPETRWLCRRLSGLTWRQGFKRRRREWQPSARTPPGVSDGCFCFVGCLRRPSLWRVRPPRGFAKIYFCSLLYLAA